MRKDTLFICKAGIITALYVVLTFLFQAISFGAIQFRISEALTILPVLFPEAIPGLTLGCLLSALLNPLGLSIYDAVFGTVATLTAAIATRFLRKNILLAAIPPVLSNGIIVGLVLTYAYHIPTPLLNMATVAIGEAVVCFALGVPLVRLLQKRKPRTEDET